jgi:hypothetical protein
MLARTVTLRLPAADVHRLQHLISQAGVPLEDYLGHLIAEHLQQAEGQGRLADFSENSSGWDWGSDDVSALPSGPRAQTNATV